MQHTGYSSQTNEAEKPAIVVQNLWKSYKGIPVLKGLNLTVPRNKTLIILGRSGVGKSVLLRQLLGLEQPDLGQIEVNGVRITGMSRKELFDQMGHFGMLFQSSALFDSMSVYENVAFYLRQHGDPKNPSQPLSEESMEEQIKEALAKVGLSGFENKMPAELSGGQKRRAALARLIIYRPTFLLYDEPTTGLDPITAMQINELVIQTQKELGATSIVVTHDMNSALMIGDYFAFHHDGKIAVFADKEEFIKSENPLIHNFFENSIIPTEYTKKITRNLRE